MIVIKKGIDLPISGVITEDTIHQASNQSLYAILGEDYLGLKPTMMVTEGDKVQEGQALFEDKKNAGVFVCAPVSGVVERVVRGERRRLLAVEIRPDASIEPLSFNSYEMQALDGLSEDSVREQLQKSGVWALLRSRPYDKTPKIDAKPHSIFINTMDSNPLSLNPMLALENREEDYQAGLKVLAKLSDGAIHVCHRPDSKFPNVDVEKVQYHAFSGIHPVGLVGTHIHFIDAVGTQKSVWHLSLQDLLAIGHLFLKGKIDNHRLCAVAGPGVLEPKIYKVRRGMNLQTLLQDNLREGEQRIVSGSVFSGRQALKDTMYLSAYDQQVSVLPEGRDSIFLEFMRPGLNSYSRTRAYLGRFVKKLLPFTTSMQGSPRPIVPFGIYEDVMPLDILPTLLLKSLVVKDTDTAIDLGALELSEEDVALLTYVDPGKHDFGAILRENLEQIEEEG